MANRYLNQFRSGFEKKSVDVRLKASIGAAGAVTIDSTNSKGVASIAKQGGDGEYLITMSDKYYKLMGLQAIFDTSGAAGAVPASPIVFIKAKSINPASGGATITIQCADAAGVVANPASGEIMLLEMTFGDSSTF